MGRAVHYEKSEIEKAYSKVAWFYNAWSTLTESKALKKALEFASVKNGELVLEIAVGTGKLFEEIVKLNPRGRNEGLDISEPMLKKARKRLKEYEHFNLVYGDASRLPYDDDTFDVLINNYMLDLLPEKDHKLLLNEFRRVLKPGGRMILTTMTFGRTPASRIWDALSRNFPSLFTNCRPLNLETKVKENNFRIKKVEYISQNTFPSLVIYAVKRKEFD